MPDVFDDTMVPGRRTASTRSSRARFASSCSMTASTIQSTSLSFARSVSKPPVVMSATPSDVKNGSGLSARARFSPSRAASGVTSRSRTGVPALAKCAAICAPIVPAPSTATLRKVDITHMLQCAASPLVLMEDRMIRVLAAACLVLALAVSARAQTAEVTGTVVDEQGAGVPGATVQLNGTSKRDFTTSGPGGAYRFSNVAVGTYDLTATLVGFAPASGARGVVGPNVTPV